MLNNYLNFGSPLIWAIFIFKLLILQNMIHKNNFFYFLFFISFSITTTGQNIVTNPNFEQYTTCPDDWYQISYCQFWSTYRETPDYYNTCSTNADFSPPNCATGFQYPHSGNAYAGFYSFASNPPNDRELIGSPLLSSLVIGQKYFISFYINLSGQIQTTIASNNIGVKFSTVPYSYSNPAPINNSAHFYCNDIITDTVKWVRIKGSFIADSAYSYIIIGNFFDDNLTDTILLSPSGNTAYYFLDDVCVTTDSLFNENWTGINDQTISISEKITIYPNPANDRVTVTSLKGEEITEIIISELTGRQVYYMHNNSGIIETDLDVSFLNFGNYVVTISTLINNYNKKLVIIK